MDAVAATGTIEAAAAALGIHPDTVMDWQQKDPDLAERIRQAKRRTGEKVVSRVVGAVLSADNDTIMQRPTAAIAAANWLLPELRPNPPSLTVSVDARSISIGDFKSAVAERRRLERDGLLEVPDRE